MNPNLKARQELVKFVEQKIADNISVHPLLLSKEDITLLRHLLRDSEEYKALKRGTKEYRWWTTAVRNILDLNERRASRKRKTPSVSSHKVMPSMKEWAESNGIELKQTLPEQHEI